MSIRIQLKRGYEQNIKPNFSLIAGEMAFVLDRGELRIGTGDGGFVRLLGDKVSRPYGIRNGNFVPEPVERGWFGIRLARPMRFAMLDTAGDTPSLEEAFPGRPIINAPDGILYLGNGTEIFEFKGQSY
jgi:hypothetical protein